MVATLPPSPRLPDSGHIDFNELVRQVMGKDITKPQFYETRALQDEAKEAAAKARGPAPRVLSDWPTSLHKHRASFEEVLLLVQRKIIERTKRPSGAPAWSNAAASRHAAMPCVMERDGG